MKKTFLLSMIFTTILYSNFQCNTHEKKCKDLREHINKKKKIGNI